MGLHEKLPVMAVIFIHERNRLEKKNPKSKNKATKSFAVPFQQDALSPDAARLILAELRQEQTRLELKNAELLRIQAELEESRARYYDFYHIAPVGFLTLTQQGKLVEVNRTLAMLLQRPINALHDLKFLDMVEHDDRELFRRHMGILFESGISQSFLVRLCRKNSFFWARIESVLTRDKDLGPVARIVIVDITERKNAELALQSQLRTEKALRTIAESALNSHSFEELCIKVREVLRFLSPAEHFSIAILDEKFQEIYYAYREVADASFPERRPIGKGLTEYAMKQRQAVFLGADEIKKLKESGEDQLAFTTVKSWLGAPLFDSNGKIFGVAALFSREKTNLLESISLEVFSVIAAQIAHSISIRRIQEAVKNSETRLGIVLDSIPDIIWIKDLSGRYQYCNPMFEKVFGRKKSELLGKTDQELIDAQHALLLTEQDLQIFQSGSMMKSEGCIHSPTDGSEIWLETIKTAMIDLEGNVTGILNIARNISERKKFQEELKSLAQTDELTGLPNRRHFFEAAEKELDRIRRYGGECSLLLIDLDSFKCINDVFGHPVGDIVLREVSRHLASALRSTDTIGRIGGEEFALLLCDTDMRGAEHVAEKLRKDVASAGLATHSGIPLPLTISIGVATNNGNKETLSELLARADAALYSAKAAGKNTIFVCNKPKGYPKSGNML